MDSQKVQEIDRKIIDLAKYAASRGGIRITTRDNVGYLFREFKRLIMTGEFSLAELTESVYRIHGDPGYICDPLYDMRDPTPEELKLMPPAEVC